MTFPHALIHTMSTGLDLILVGFPVTKPSLTKLRIFWPKQFKQTKNSNQLTRSYSK